MSLRRPGSNPGPRIDARLAEMVDAGVQEKVYNIFI